jgi:hypothetical protein
MRLIQRGTAALTVLAALLAVSSCSAATTRPSGPSAPASPARPAPAASPATPASPVTPAAAAGAYGNLRIGFIPALGAKPVRPPITVTLVVRADGSRTRTTWETTGDPSARGFRFHLALPPGRYQVQALALRSASLSPSPFAIPTSGPAFTVPRGGCAYIGLISIVYYRLPPGTPSQQGTAASGLAHGKQAYFSYLKAGGLLPDTATVTLPPATQRPAGSQACATHRARF